MKPKSRIQQIGIDRIVRLEWLERTAQLALADNQPSTVKQNMLEILAASFPTSNPSVRGSLSKTVTILMNVWLSGPRELADLRKGGLELLRIKSGGDRLAIHWAMLMATYPFWGAVAGQAGRLLRLQETITAEQVQRRICEQYGERESVFRRVRYVLRSFIAWGILQETETKGIYRRGLTLSIDDPKLIALMIEAALHANSNGSTRLTDLLESTNLFPFRLKRTAAESLLIASPRLECVRHNMDDELVMLKRL
ncbi:MAG: hypothetical protein NTZ24_14025 [Deltaproteobacteria bacterium]|nr:hypothetical protein [Deltaproteobacteria bacterium]